MDRLSEIYKLIHRLNYDIIKNKIKIEKLCQDLKDLKKEESLKRKTNLKDCQCEEVSDYERGNFNQNDLVDLNELDSMIQLEGVEYVMRQIENYYRMNIIPNNIWEIVYDFVQKNYKYKK